MADFVLEDNQNVTLAITPVDGAGNPAGVFDASTVTAAFADANLTAAVSADETSIVVTAVGPLGTDNVLTITGSVNGVSVSTQFPIDVIASAVSSISVTPGTPSTNA